ncbi:MAG: low molecular weight phosphatase family protein [Candidatus Rokuibacteriota bacterium]
MNTSRSVLFVCLHGAAKSVLAAADFQHLAAGRGLALTADSAGTEPDPEIAPGVVAALRADGLDLSGKRPRRVTRDDTAGAARVVTFGCDLGEAMPASVPVERWDDVPAVSENLPVARAAIRRHLERLLEECAAEEARP